MAELRSSSQQLTSQKPARVPVVAAVLTAALGAFSMGCALGYSSPASPQLSVPDNFTRENCTTDDCPCLADDISYTLGTQQISWFGSIINIGALVGAPLGGFCINKFGRRMTMIGSLSSFFTSWILIGFAQGFVMLAIGRFFSGVSAGLVCLSAPNYISEISSPDIRGLLSSVFQLNTVTGILYAYAVGAGLCWQWLALACLLPAVIFSVGMIFHKNSPAFLVAKDKEEEARAALRHFRGPNYNIETELALLKEAAEQEKNNTVSMKDLLEPHILKPLCISVGLMFFQQFCGINAILFNLNAIFDSAHSNMSASTSSILVGAVQVVATAVAAVLMDKAGRKLLLIVSSSVMSVSLVAMGVFFYLDSEHKAEYITWLPLVCLVVFITFFSIGFGPIPWVMMGELFTSDVKAMASTLATLTCWGCSFIVTLAFQPLQEAIHDYGVYWLFAGLAAVSLLFSIFVVKETKGKSLEEICAMFGKPPTSGFDQRKSSIRRSASSNTSAGSRI